MHIISSVILDIYLGEEPQPIPFPMVHDGFPVPHTGLLGRSFLVDNGFTIDYWTSRLFQFLQCNCFCVTSKSPKVLAQKVPEESKIKLILVPVTSKNLKEQIEIKEINWKKLNIYLYALEIF